MPRQLACHPAQPSLKQHPEPWCGDGMQLAGREGAYPSLQKKKDSMLTHPRPMDLIASTDLALRVLDS